MNLLPLGGYVRMPGENGETTDENGNPDTRTFGAQSAGKRAAILVAGVTMNLLFAWVIYTGIFAVEGVGHADYAYVYSVVKNSPAQAAQLQKNDRIIAINGQSVTDAASTHDAIVKAIAADKTNDATVPLTVTVLRDGKQSIIHVNALHNPPGCQGNIGISIGEHVISTPLPLWKTPLLGVQQIGVNFAAEGDGIHQILVGAIKPSCAVAGPVGIVKATGDAANQGFGSLIDLTAFLSWNLAVVNLLPIPGLDGGRLLILGIEVLRRGRRLAPEREALINLAGMVFLLSLIAIITFNDISHIVGH